LRVTVQLAAVRSGHTPEARPASVQRLAEELGLPLEPLHPGVDDPVLRSYYTVEVPDRVAAAVLARLRASPAVAAAYVKPPEAAP
jgi:hypothetical protein